jgi:hypothetical protein
MAGVLKRRIAAVEKQMGFNPEGRYREFLSKYYEIISSCKKRIPPQDEEQLRQAGFQEEALFSEYPLESSIFEKEMMEYLGGG